MTNPKHTSSDLEAQLRTNFYAQCKEFADRIAALEVENERLRGALVGAAFEFDLIVQRIREGQPRRGEGIAVCSAIEARAALGEKP